MSDAKTDRSALSDRHIDVSVADLQAAWAVLENLVVSIDQLGGCFGNVTELAGADRHHALAAALGSYLTEDLIQAIGDARSRLARYIPDPEAEVLADSIPYWDYAGIKS